MPPRSSARFDRTRRYRYSLSRRWGEGAERVVFVMLNPSTADECADDPTIRRCIGFARAWGFETLEVVNLYAFRATRPAELFAAADPVGPRNDCFLRAAAREAALVVAAWGLHGARAGRDSEVLEILRRRGPVHCLGTTQRGQPRHPLFVRRGVRPRRLSPAGAPEGG